MNNNNFMRPLEILIVEDNSSDTDLLREAFNRTNIKHNLNFVTDGSKALSYIRHEGPYEKSKRPDLILLDLNLPKKSGHEVLREIRSDPLLSNLPVIILSASSLDQDIDAAYSFNANCYLSKPSDFNEFMNLIAIIEKFWLSSAKLPPM